MDQIFQPTKKLLRGICFFHTLFEECCFAIGGTKIHGWNGMYPYQAYIQNQFITEKKNGELTAELYYKDSNPDSFDPEKNSGFKTRMELAAGSKEFEMMGKLGLGIFQEKRYFPPHVKLSMSLKRSAPDFCLSPPNANGTYRIVFDEVIFFAKVVEVSQNIVKHHQSLFERRQKCIFPFVQTKLGSFSINAGSKDCTLPQETKTLQKF